LLRKSALAPIQALLPQEDRKALGALVVLSASLSFANSPRSLAINFQIDTWDHTLRVWDLESRQAVRTLKGHSNSVNGVAITPDGERAVSASSDKTLRVWDLESGQAVRTLEGHTYWVNGVAITPDGGRAVSASWDHTLRMWELESGQTVRTLKGHTYWVNGVAITPGGLGVPRQDAAGVEPGERPNRTYAQRPQ